MAFYHFGSCCYYVTCFMYLCGLSQHTDARLHVDTRTPVFGDLSLEVTNIDDTHYDFTNDF